jgi:hypothetical protein
VSSAWDSAARAGAESMGEWGFGGGGVGGGTSSGHRQRVSGGVEREHAGLRELAGEHA